MSVILKIHNANKHYGGVVALRDAHFELRTGEVHALMGENGAGKSTLAKVIAGTVRPDSARILIDDAPVSISNPLDAQRQGIAIIYQELDLFRQLSVAENIVIGNLEFESSSFVNRREMDFVCAPFLNAVGLRCSPRRLVATLSIGEMQLVAIARALSMKARIILMDEPTSALFEDSAERLFQLICDLKQRNVSVVYVSHKMNEIERICDRATVMRDGATVGTKDLAGTSVDELIRMMVGRPFKRSERQRKAKSSDVRLSVRGLTTSKLRAVSFELYRGEVLGIAGLVGAGRSELGNALFGLDRWHAGEVYLDGKPLTPRSPREALKAGLAFVPEDRKLDGLMMQMSVLENSTLAVVGRMQRFGFFRVNAEIHTAQPFFEALSLRAPSYEVPVTSLSGGNQQKVLLAKSLLTNPRVLFLDDPARGIDIAAKQDIYRIIADVAAEGTSVIFVSSELPELLLCCDRIIVLKAGCVTALFDAEEATQEAIMSAALMEGGTR